MIQISEILPNAKSQDKGNEWIEITNLNDSSVNLFNWTIELISIDKKKTVQEKIKKNLIIQPKNTGIYKTKNLLPNKGATLTLIDPNGAVGDSISYLNAKENLSYQKITVYTDFGEKIKELWNTPNLGIKNPSIYEKILTIKTADLPPSPWEKIFDKNYLTSIFSEKNLIKETVDENQNLLNLQIIDSGNNSIEKIDNSFFPSFFLIILLISATFLITYFELWLPKQQQT